MPERKRLIGVAVVRRRDESVSENGVSSYLFGEAAMGDSPPGIDHRNPAVICVDSSDGHESLALRCAQG